MDTEPVVSISARAAALGEPWQPQDLATVNHETLRLVRLDGAFPWHKHDADELFLCWQGVFRIELRGHHPITLAEGEVFVVRSGIEHRPVADHPAYALQTGTQPHVPATPV